MRARCWLLTLLLSALLAAQTLQAAHVHADHPAAEECLQCQVDSCKVFLAATSSAASATGAEVLNSPQAAAAPYSNHYRLSARGPPALSC
jgi:hypothetical protein